MVYDMVLEGGGAKGIAFVGAMQELEARDIAPARLLGTSAGAVTATFLAAGYNSKEMAEVLAETDNGQPVFLGFLEAPGTPSAEELHNSAIRQLLREVNLKAVPDFIEDKIDDAIVSLLSYSERANRLFSFVDKGGFCAGQKFLNWLGEKLNSGVYEQERGNFGKGSHRQFGAMNMEEFFQATGVELSLIASDTSAASILILNHRTAPQCPITAAVRMSMSVPLLWQEVVWQPEWGQYRGRDISGHTVVDGGLLSNFPIELFISDQPYVTDIMGKKTETVSGVLGLLIDEDLPVPGEEKPITSVDGFAFGRLKTVQRVTNLLNTMLQAHDKEVMEAYEDRVIHLPAKGYGTVEFGLSQQRRDALVSAGRSAAVAYFERPEEGGERDLSTPSTVDQVALRMLAE